MFLIFKGMQFMMDQAVELSFFYLVVLSAVNGAQIQRVNSYKKGFYFEEASAFVKVLDVLRAVLKARFKKHPLILREL